MYMHSNFVVNHFLCIAFTFWKEKIPEDLNEVRLYSKSLEKDNITGYVYM